jgi:hypothetical protein
MVINTTAQVAETCECSTPLPPPALKKAAETVTTLPYGHAMAVAPTCPYEDFFTASQAFRQANGEATGCQSAGRS